MERIFKCFILTLVLCIVLASIAFAGELENQLMFRNIDEIKVLLDKGADVNAKDRDGNTALMWHAGYGHTDVVRFLIEKGADVNAYDKRGNTALMDAARYGHADIVRVLVERGADMNAQDHDGNTALILAAMDVYTDVVRFLINNGADLNAITNGLTALHFARWNKSEENMTLTYTPKLRIEIDEIVRMLEQAGAR